MNIVKGQKCKFVNRLGNKVDGEVFSLDKNDMFTVYEPMNTPLQYNDSFVEYLTEDDIGKRVWFD